MKKYLLLVALVICGSSHAADTLRIDRKQYETNRWDRNFVSQTKENPSIYFFQQNFSYSEIGVSGGYAKNNKPLLLQQGEGLRSFSVNTFTYTILSPNTKVWGTASYENKVRYNVKFNNISDWELLTPYITADSVGGDMKSETYSFSGGYGHQIKKYTLAATIAYRAMNEYRDVDPRPKNVVSDLKASIGASREFYDSYRLGFSLNGGKYKQTSSIKTFSELGGASQYHLIGLGEEYSRFAGTFPNSFYDGFSYGATFNLIPKNENGFYGSVSYNKFKVDKSMNDLNDIVLTTLHNSEIKSEIAFQKNNKGVKIDYSHKKKAGLENIFGTGSGGSYPLLSSEENYQNSTNQLSLTALFGSDSWKLLPQITYHDNTIEHIENHLNYSGITGAMDFQYNFHRKNASYLVTLGGAYDKNIKNGGKLTTSVTSIKPLIESYLALSKQDFYNIYLKLRSDVPLPTLQCGMFAELNINYNNLTNSGLFIKIGCVF